jgi:hypothetical protein
VRPRSVTLRLAAVAVGCSAVLGVAAGPAAASDAGTLVSDTNALRASHGLIGYRVCPDLAGIAAAWAAHLASTGMLAHNTALAGEMHGWEALAENVGEGGSAAGVQTLFEQSPDHLANLVSSTYTEVGIGTARGKNGTLWVDEVFRTPSGNACGGSAAPVSAPVSRPAPAASPTAAAPRATRAPAAAAPQPTMPEAPTAAQVGQRLAAAQRAALRARLSAGGAPTGAAAGDVVGDALAFAALLRPVR